MRELTDRDVHGALSVVAESSAPAASDGPFGFPMLVRLGELVGADHALYIEYDLETHGWGPSSLEYPRVAYPAGDYSEVCEHNPLREESVGDTDVPLALSDFLTPRAYGRNPWVQEVMRPVGEEYELKIFLPAAPGITREFDFTRGSGSDFNDRDRAILQLLRPHLARILQRWEHHGRPDALTARERELMQHVARGLTNREIAEQLVVSTHTVRSHLEHIYEKLGVHTRTAAVAAVAA